MKILHIGKYYPPFHGGIENFMADLIIEQRLRGEDVQAMVHHHENNKSSGLEACADGDVFRVAKFGTLAFVPISPSFGVHMNKILDNFNPNVIHMHMPNVSCFWALFSIKAKSIPWVIHWHSDVVGAAPDWRVKALYPIYGVFEKKLLQQAAKIIVTSGPYLDTSKPLKNFRSKCEVVQLGIRDSGKIETINSVKKNAGTLRLLCIGRLTYYKGHEVLLRAMKELSARQVNVVLEVIGQGELENFLLELIENLGLQENVELSGAVSDEALNSAILASDLICLPSIERTEAFGVVLLEAMRAGRATLVTDVVGSGMSWVVKKEQTGLVVKTNDIGSLVDAVEMISKDLNKLERMGINAKQRFLDMFTIKDVAGKIEAIYKSSLNRH